MILSKYRLKLQRRERVVEVVNERGYDHIVSQIIMDNHRGYYPDRDSKFLEALREEYEFKKPDSLDHGWEQIND